MLTVEPVWTVVGGRLVVAGSVVEGAVVDGPVVEGPVVEGAVVEGAVLVVGLLVVVEGPPRGGGRPANSASFFSATRLLTYWWAWPSEGSSCPDRRASRLYESTEADE